jgi:adenylate cyclase
MEIHANAVRTLLNSRPISEPAPMPMWLLAIVPGLCSILAFGRLNWLRAAIVTVLTALFWLALSIAMFTLYNFALPVAVPLIGLALGAGGMGAYRAFGEERERQQVMGLWGRYQDPRQVEYLLQHPQARGGQGQEAPVTVLFADLKNFTKTVEHLSPSEALQVLNRYLALMTDVIRDEYGGFVDKYLGDGLMAQWGAPPPWQPWRENEDHATTAVRACLELERRTRELTQSIAGDRDVTFGLRLTLHTGPVVVGWVGASRLEFTIIGDTVNVTSRLQETAKELNCEFLISETTYLSVAEWVRTGKQAEVAIRGRDKPLRVYEVLGD